MECAILPLLNANVLTGETSDMAESDSRRTEEISGQGESNLTSTSADQCQGIESVLRLDLMAQSDAPVLSKLCNSITCSHAPHTFSMDRARRKGISSVESVVTSSGGSTS